MRYSCEMSMRGMRKAEHFVKIWKAYDVLTWSFQKCCWSLRKNRTFLFFLRAHHVRYMSAICPLRFIEEKLNIFLIPPMFFLVQIIFICAQQMFPFLLTDIAELAVITVVEFWFGVEWSVFIEYLFNQFFQGNLKRFPHVCVSLYVFTANFMFNWFWVVPNVIYIRCDIFIFWVRLR